MQALEACSCRLRREGDGERFVALEQILYARTVVPVGGRTEFADMRAAWATLPAEMQERIDKLVVEHSIFHSRAKLGFTDFSDRERAALPPATQLMVRTIPETGQRSRVTQSAVRGRSVQHPGWPRYLRQVQAREAATERPPGMHLPRARSQPS